MRPLDVRPEVRLCGDGPSLAPMPNLPDPATRTGWMPSGETLVRWRIPAVAAGLGLASVAVMAAATATKDHNFWVFAGWVVLTVAAVVAGVAVLMAVPRARTSMGVRRAASFGVVIAVLCATLGLAVYSQTRTHDCPTTGPCTPATPGSGQRPQLP
jgi:peptidoglycan/LPS O-acetylase OafA/YrhL